MGKHLSAFQQLLHDRLIPEFCADGTRFLEPKNFKVASFVVSEEDARYFLLGFNAGLMKHVGRGQYQTSAKAAKEQFFWEGRRASNPRPFTLWLEPILALGCLARLHFDHRWPKELIGAQSPDFAFDIVANMPAQSHEYIACEIKKAPTEFARLSEMMTVYAGDPSISLPPSGPERNAYKKVSAMRLRQPRILWVAGPNGLCQVFQPNYAVDSSIDLIEVQACLLDYVGGDGLRRA